ncbi:hypothetical protein PR048_011645 [Dryococelus australis]|uniref:Uncharacterized protein n=1 Tax=Dryococelus australis TaxID=614101 RepID=A0ABQ9HM74_9NEOP|nr:hypothetical protein PR048_011645 [Dryococelus australis]
MVLHGHSSSLSQFFKGPHVQRPLMCTQTRPRMLGDTQVVTSGATPALRSKGGLSCPQDVCHFTILARSFWHFELGSIPGRLTRFSQVGIGPNDDTGRWVLSGISCFPHPFIPGSLHIHFNQPSSAQDLATRVLACQSGNCERSHCEVQVHITLSFVCISLAIRSRGGVEVRLFTYHLGELGSIPSWVAARFLQEVTVPDDAAGHPQGFIAIPLATIPRVEQWILTTPDEPSPGDSIRPKDAL